jgi:sugar-specific transcriptional regulator TrmB
MNIKGILNKIGLNNKEADVYISCLENGPISMTNLARLSGYKRSTLYNIIEALLREGYIVLIRRNRRTLYDAEKPKKLLTSIKARERELEQILPELEIIRNNKNEIPNIEVYESAESIKILYDEIYDKFDSGEEFCFLTSVADLERNLPEAMDSYNRKVLEKKNNKIRELVFNDEVGRKHIKYLKNSGASHQIKLLSGNFPLYNDLVIYSNVVIIFSFKNRIIATKFQNKEIAETIKTLFEAAWQNGIV